MKKVKVNIASFPAANHYYVTLETAINARRSFNSEAFHAANRNVYAADFHSFSALPSRFEN
jgi:hypothetical protein